jgi:hypothetical protein
MPQFLVEAGTLTGIGGASGSGSARWRTWCRLIHFRSLGRWMIVSLAFSILVGIGFWVVPGLSRRRWTRHRAPLRCLSLPRPRGCPTFEGDAPISKR